MEYHFNGVALDVRQRLTKHLKYIYIYIAIKRRRKKIIVLLTTTPIYMPVLLKFKLGYPPAMGINNINKGSFLFVGFYCHFSYFDRIFFRLCSYLVFGFSFQAYSTQTCLPSH